jgi:Domain of unknown function (DUF4337)
VSADVSHTIEASHGNRLVSLAAAIIAVLAALGTLFSHHRSITALSVKNAAILTQARATDTYNAYEAKQIRYNIYRAVLASEIVRDAKTRAQLQNVADDERASSPAVLKKAEALDAQAVRDDDRSEVIMRSYETLQFATTLFDISIILVALATLAGTRVFLSLGCGLSLIGLVLFIFGLVQPH